MNRRTFLLASSLASVSLRTVFARDRERVESPLYRMLDVLPLRNGDNEAQFAQVRAQDLVHLRQIDIAFDAVWNPMDQDLLTVFGFPTTAISALVSTQGGGFLALWQMDPEFMDEGAMRATLIESGWVEDGELLVDTRSEEEREAFAATLHVAGDIVLRGDWTAVAISADSYHVIVASDSQLANNALQRLRQETTVATFASVFGNLHSVLPATAFDVMLIPSPLHTADALFGVRFRDEDDNELQGIGISPKSGDEHTFEFTRKAVQYKLDTEASAITDTLFSDFLTLKNIDTEWSIGRRLDFASADPDWTAVNAMMEHDLGLLPTVSPVG